MPHEVRAVVAVKREGAITDDFPCLIDQYLYRLLDLPAFVTTTLDP
ncbi:hypothetical protein ACWCQK_20715 [Streptomyces sp. NPDC002306]